MSLRILFIVICFCALAPVLAVAQEEMSIEEIYHAIPHERTIYDPGQSRAPEADAEYLDHMFSLTDQALRARFLTLQNLYYERGGMDIDSYNGEVADIVAQFELADTPGILQPVQSAIVEAVRAQQDFLNHWAEAAGTDEYQQIKNNLTSNPDVIRAHTKLVEAYNMLMQLYPEESAQNKKAFFNYLCALDFL